MATSCHVSNSHKSLFSKGVSKNEYYNYVTSLNNGLLKEFTSNNFAFLLQYKPLEFEALNSIIDTLTESEFDSILNLKRGYQYFTLSIQGKNSSIAENDKISEYLSFLPNENITLCDSLDTIPSLGTHYISPVIKSQPHKVLLFFKDSGLKNHFSVRFQSNMERVEIVNFNFKKEEINRVPKLNIQG